MKMVAEIELTDKLMSRFEMFPNFRRPVNNENKRIISIKFSADGEKLVAASNQSTIELYNCNTSQQENFFRLYKHGISAVDYMNSNDLLLVGSGGLIKNDYAVRELDLTKNQFNTCYTGHQGVVTSLSVNVERKFFLTGAADRSAMFFDFRAPHSQLSFTNLADVPLVAMHPTSQLCAIALESNRIEMFDIRSMNYGPFRIFKLNSDNVKWTSLKFSPNGKQLLISSNSSKIRVISSTTAAVQEVFGSRKNTLNIPIDASFTPNSEYILSGSSDGNVFIFSNNRKDQRKITFADREQKVAELQSMQRESITAIEMNSKYSLMATGSSYVAFWAPNAAD